MARAGGRRARRSPAERLAAGDLSAAVLDTAGALVVVLDRKGRIVRFNRACERTTGWRFEEVRGRPLWDFLLLPEEAAAVREVFGRLVSGDFPNTHENHWVARDGARRRIAWSNTALLGPGGAVRHVIGTGIDVTAQRQAEEALRRQAARLEALADASHAFSSALDYRTTLDTVARCLADLIGDSCLVRVVSDDGAWLELVAYAHRNPERGALVRAIQESSPQRVDEGLTGRVIRTGVSLLVPLLTEERIRADMKPQYWPYLGGVTSLLIAPLRARGRVFGHVTLLRDAPGPAYGAEDQAFLEDLAARAADCIENARLYGLAQAAVAARDEFLSIASHELRTPLTALKLAAQNLKRVALATCGDAADQVRNSVDAAERQGVRLEKLISALLDVSRIQVGRIELAPEELDLGTLVAETLAQFEEQIAETGSRVATRVEGQVRGRWDRLRLGQVVTNLVSNAVKYGEGKPIEIGIEGNGERVRLSVRDHGIGLAEESQHRIFQRFVRASQARNYGGLGLGLYIARRLTEAHGGTVHVTSAPGEGSTFTVELPVRGPAAAETGAASTVH
jgi:PAS domain S-box-containing protein